MMKNFKSTKNIVLKILENKKIFKNESYILWKLKENWIEITGKTIGENTDLKWLKNGILTVNVSDPSIYHSIITYQNVIINKSNEFLEKKYINKLEILKINKSIRRNITEELVKNEKIRNDEDEDIEQDLDEIILKEEKEFNNIKISSEEIFEIENSINKIDEKYKEFSEKLKEIAINRKKKDKYLLTKKYKMCDKCGTIYYPGKNEKICFECYEKEENKKIEFMKKIIKENPFIGEKEAVLLTNTDDYTYYRVRDILAQRTYFELLYFCERTDLDIEINKDYSSEIRNEAKIELEILIKIYIDYKIGTEDNTIFQNERNKILKKLKREINFRKKR